MQMSTPPRGTLHEAFFDPITDGTAVAAGDSNGVLKPASVHRCQRGLGDPGAHRVGTG